MPIFREYCSLLHQGETQPDTIKISKYNNKCETDKYADIVPVVRYNRLLNFIVQEKKLPLKLNSEIVPERADIEKNILEEIIDNEKSERVEYFLVRTERRGTDTRHACTYIARIRALIYIPYVSVQ